MVVIFLSTVLIFKLQNVTLYIFFVYLLQYFFFFTFQAARNIF